MNRNWRRIIIHGSAAGLLSGLVLGGLLKWIEHESGKLVYTLLLNVDFVDWLPQTMPEWLEFGLHLLIAVPLGWLYAVLTTWRGRPWLLAAAIGLTASLTWVPLTLASDRTPGTGDLSALLWWLSGHLVYAGVLGGYGKLVMSHRAGRR
ncbi:hypothetical protein [Paenibacillus sp. 1P07SE]|uniref:hypothetical protein n=1 Tax=Paenibacillus sp. 1P07SE TaxID=3132209 RepID=UPI0039A71FD8